MQNQNHTALDDKFAMNFGGFDPDNLFSTHMGNMGVGMKRSAHEAGLDREAMGLSSDDDTDFMKKEGGLNASSSGRENMIHQQTSLDQPQQKQNLLPNGKKTKGRVKIKMEFIDNKLRRYTTFSKRKTGIMKKAYELSTLTGTQVMLLVASETGHVYTFATRKLQPMITSEAGKALIQTCLNSPDPPSSHQYHHHDQRMSATGYEETELTYAVPDDDNSKGCESSAPGQTEHSLAASSSASECSSPPVSPPPSPPPQLHDDSSLTHGLDSDRSVFGPVCSSSSNSSSAVAATSCSSTSLQLPSGLLITPTPPLSGGVVVGNSGSSVVYATGGGLVYAPPAQVRDGAAGSSAASTPLYLPIQLAQNIASVPRTGVGVKRSQESSSGQSNFSRIINSTSDLPTIVSNSSLIRKLANNDLSISTNIVNSSLQLANDSSSEASSISNNRTGAFNASCSGGVVISNKGCRVQVPVVTISSETSLMHKNPRTASNTVFNSSGSSTVLAGLTSRSSMSMNCSKLSDSSISPETAGVSAEAINRSSSSIVSRPNPCSAAAFRPSVNSCAKLLFSDEEDLSEDEPGEHDPENGSDSVQQAFPTDLSMNVRRKK